MITGSQTLPTDDAVVQYNPEMGIAYACQEWSCRTAQSHSHARRPYLVKGEAIVRNSEIALSQARQDAENGSTDDK